MTSGVPRTFFTDGYRVWSSARALDRWRLSWGHEIIQDSHNAQEAAAWPAAGAARLGASYTLNQCWDGTIADFFLFARVLTDAERASLMAYLDTYYSTPPGGGGRTARVIQPCFIGL